MQQPERFTATIGTNVISAELNNWAEQANGSVVIRCGDTVVLVTAVMNSSPREGGDFFPLTVDYEEKFYASGRILGSRFVKRETRPSEEAILAARLIDRTIRPRFDLRMRNEVQVVATVLAIDDENDPDVLAILGASLALGLSDIPWQGPVAGVRVSRTDNAFVVNPGYTERAVADLDLVVAGTEDRINMLEAGANEISEEDFASAVEFGFRAVQDLIAFQNSIIEKRGRPKTTVPLVEPSPELRSLLDSEFAAKIEDATYQREKSVMRAKTEEIKALWLARAAEACPDTFRKDAAEYLFEKAVDSIIHRRIIERSERPDGRKPDEIRPLSAAVGVLPRVHGSGLFMRGETHALSTLTLGAPGDEQIVEGMEVRTKKRFLHHYNFPPYSTGETKPMRGPGRREIGHGALAGRAISPMLPPKEEFPYTIRIVSEILSSNGSTSMASVCGSTLALMDAGVPIKKPVAGAAMGLVVNERGEYKVLTDLQGPEDHHGDMDFKIAGTRDGITAAQLDVKINGITMPMILDTLRAAHRARMQILDVLASAIASPRPELSPYAPRITTIKINPEKIGTLIGPGGKVINDIVAKTGAQIDIEDDGSVFITSPTKDGMDRALAMVSEITREYKTGDLLEGTVSRIFGFGAMVEVGPKKEGLIHISELAPWRVNQVEDIVKVGDKIRVVVQNIDDQGRLNLSLKHVPGRYSADDIARGEAEAAARRQFAPAGDRTDRGPRHDRSGGQTRRSKRRHS